MSKYSLTTHQMPRVPRLKGYLKHVISPVPKHMHPAAAQQVLIPTQQHLSPNTSFTYIDGTEKRGCDLIHMAITVAPSASGKGYLEPMYKAVSRYWMQKSEENLRKLIEWSKTCKSKGQSKDRPRRPSGKDAVIYTPVADQTNAAFIQNLCDAEEAGDNCVYTRMPELDMIIGCCGGKSKVTKVIRLNYDASKGVGTLRATEAGVSGDPAARWLWNASCVMEKARNFFRGEYLTDGTLGRIGFAYMPKPESHEMPQQGKYDEKYHEKLEEYLLRLRNATGHFIIKPLNSLINRLKGELDEICDLTDDTDSIFLSYCHRSLETAWRKGCLLYILEGCRWTKETADYIEWSLYYDLWSKVQIFSPQMRKAQGAGIVDVQKFGPTNMLAELPNDFSQAQLEQLRASKDMPIYCATQLRNWVNRGYITRSAQTGLYSKTEEYLLKHPQPQN